MTTQVHTPLWKLKAIDGITVNLGRVIKYGAWVWIAKYGYYSVVALAGKQTVAEVALKFIASLTISKTICLTAAAGGVAWGAAERKLRKGTIRKKAKRIKHLEEQVDPGRSSSSLMADGSTRPEDEDI